MIKSMTGYGRYEIEEKERKVNVEISTVNHRYCDLSIRMPKALTHLEDEIRKCIKQFIARGKVEVSIYITSMSADDVEVVVNEPACTAYIEALRKIGAKLGLNDNIGMAEVMRLNDVITIQKKQADLEVIWPMIDQALRQALTQLVAMREKEGMILKKDLLEKADNMLRLVGELEHLSVEVVNTYKLKLEERISRLLEEIPVDETRLAMEVALFEDRAAIDEELTRLKSHVGQLKMILEEESSIGRKLDFLMQEMNREANTIASKAGDYTITSYAVELKSEIEKIREQIQNIE
ncbi:MAG: YicC/YloC family endoribonuclease [Zhenhengia sp.]|uniref:YicC/YloC family endoribonuclease n=1 Tax=Zhenhengia sp. TaxID=2944208 RepID=UPI0039917DF8